MLFDVLATTVLTVGPFALVAVAFFPEEEFGFGLVTGFAFGLVAGFAFGLVAVFFLGLDAVDGVFFFVMIRVCREYFFKQAWQELQRSGAKLSPIARLLPIQVPIANYAGI